MYIMVTSHDKSFYFTGQSAVRSEADPLQIALALTLLQVIFIIQQIEFRITDWQYKYFVPLSTRC